MRALSRKTVVYKSNDGITLFCKVMPSFNLYVIAFYLLVGFNHLSNHLKNSRCHNSAFCGLSIQWFSSGNTSMCDGIPRSCAALNAIIPCDARIR